MQKIPEYVSNPLQFIPFQKSTCDQEWLTKAKIVALKELTWVIKRWCCHLQDFQQRCQRSQCWNRSRIPDGLMKFFHFPFLSSGKGCILGPDLFLRARSTRISVIDQAVSSSFVWKPDLSVITISNTISGYLIILPQTWFAKYCSTLISNFNRDFLWKFELQGIPFKTMVLTRF